MGERQKSRPLSCLIVGGLVDATRDIAIKFADEGGRIILTGLPDEKEPFYKLGRKCSNLGSPSTDVHNVDLKDPGIIDTLMHSVVSRQGYIDVLVIICKAYPDTSPPADVRCMNGDHANTAVRLAWQVAEHMRTRDPSHVRAIISVVDSSCAGPASAAAAMLQFTQANHEALAKDNIKLMAIDTAGCTSSEGVAEAALLPLHPGKQPSEVPEVLALKDLSGKHQDGEGSKGKGGNVGGSDGESKHEGVDPGPNPEGTMRHDNAEEAAYIKAEVKVGGIVEATGKRKTGGLLWRKADEGEIGRSAVDKSGMVMAPADPGNLEPEEGHFYDNDPKDRHPSMMVQCYKPYNGETLHSLLAESWLTPPTFHYVRNHLPVPERIDAAQHKFVVESEGVPGIKSMQFSVPELAERFPRAELYATLECAGNRRAEACAVNTVEGRAPWNHGAIGNSRWTGVWLRDVLKDCGVDVDAAWLSADYPAKHIWFEGLDWHRKSGEHFQVSIPIEKAVHPHGDCIIAWEQNGEELQMDHGYPVRVVMPGFVGTRSVKWLKRIVVAAGDSKSPWQQKDYKQFPPIVQNSGDAKPFLTKLPPIMAQPTNSAILVPESGCTIPRSTKALMVRGYAWAGGGLPIIRVDVSADAGATWEMADIVESRMEPHGIAWSWVLWQIPLKVPPHYRQNGGKMRLCCKAWNRNYDTQPQTAEEIWNYRGLNVNSWHYVDLCVE